MVDDCVYIQQCAGRSKVGYKVFYEYKHTFMEGSLNFSSQAADKDYWNQEMLNSEQRMAQMKSQEEILPMPSAQKKKCPKPNKRAMVNKSVVRVVTSKVHKMAFKKPKARKACQAIQSELGARVDGAHAASPN